MKAPLASRFTVASTVLGLLVASILLAACDREPRERKADTDPTSGQESPVSAEAAPDSPKTTVYRVRGLVRKVAEDRSMAVIDHEEIPGYMEAMSMPFYPKEPSVFSSLDAGQNIEFDYHVEGDRSWVENVEVLPKSAVQTATEKDAAPNPPGRQGQP